MEEVGKDEKGGEKRDRKVGEVINDLSTTFITKSELQLREIYRNERKLKFYLYLSTRA